MGAWSPLVGLLEGLLLACAGLGVLLGLAIKAVAGSDEDRHAVSHKLIAAASVGLLAGLLARDVYGMIFSWMGG